MMRVAKIMIIYLRKRYPWLHVIWCLVAVLGISGFAFIRLLLEKLL